MRHRFFIKDDSFVIGLSAPCPGRRAKLMLKNRTFVVALKGKRQDRAQPRR